MKLSDAFHFNRVIARGLSRVLIRTPLTPNQVTTLSLCSAFVGAAFFSMGTRGFLLAGAAALQLSFILDDCDGEIARAKSLQSTFGMWYDFAADLAADLALWTGLAVASWRLGVSPAAAAGIAVLAAVGSVINFFRVTQRRLRGYSGKEPSPSRNPFLAALHVLGNDGDPTILVWAAAVALPADWLLVAGCVYIHSLWLASLWLERRSRSI